MGRGAEKKAVKDRKGLVFCILCLFFPSIHLPGDPLRVASQKAGSSPSRPTVEAEGAEEEASVIPALPPTPRTSPQDTACALLVQLHQCGRAGLKPM